MNTPHTPGPWKWVGTKADPQSRVYLSAPDGYACWTGSGETEIANARLIASAPSLLTQRNKLREALEQVFKLIDDQWLVKDGWAIHQMSAVQTLAKARAVLSSTKD